MPQLVKGGKFVYGWVKLSEYGFVRIPDQAYLEYGYNPYDDLFLLEGSKQSGGFGVSSRRLLEDSKFGDILKELLSKIDKKNPIEGININKKKMFITKILKDKKFKIPKAAINHFNLEYGRLLLVVRGSRVALGCIMKGKIYEVAKMHPEILVY